jgi:hypothetical protein
MNTVLTAQVSLVACWSFRPFRLQPLPFPQCRFHTLPFSALDFRAEQAPRGPGFAHGVQARRNDSRIEFVILRTGRSPPVALHLALRQRSYFQLRAGECVPEEDLHLSVPTRFPNAHPCRLVRQVSEILWLESLCVLGKTPAGSSGR